MSAHDLTLCFSHTQRYLHCEGGFCAGTPEGTRKLRCHLPSQQVLTPCPSALGGLLRPRKRALGREDREFLSPGDLECDLKVGAGLGPIL